MTAVESRVSSVHDVRTVVSQVLGSSDAMCKSNWASKEGLSSVFSVETVVGQVLLACSMETVAVLRQVERYVLDTVSYIHLTLPTIFRV